MTTPDTPHTRTEPTPGPEDEDAVYVLTAKGLLANILRDLEVTDLRLQEWAWMTFREAAMRHARRDGESGVAAIVLTDDGGRFVMVQESPSARGEVQG